MKLVIRRRSYIMSLGLCGLTLLGNAAVGHAAISMGPQQTFLHVHADESPKPAALIIDLAAIEAPPGATLVIDQRGEFIGISGGGDIETVMHGVFSSSNAVLGEANLNRVPGAIASGLPNYVTGATCPNNSTVEATDIPEDFRVDIGASTSVTVTVPGGALYLFIGIPDCYYTDNSDPDGNLGVAVSVQTSVGPQQTFLHVHADEAPNPAPLIFDLTELGASAGESILVEQLGDFIGISGGGDVETVMHGVFSSSNTVLGEASLNRVPGAIVSGLPNYLTGATCPNNSTVEPTDIPEDFRVDIGLSKSVTATVPAGASYLLIGIPDCYYADNSDPNSNLEVRVTKVSALAAPALHPQIVVLLAALLSGAAYWKRRQLRHAAQRV